MGRRSQNKHAKGTYAFDRNGKKWARRESVYKDDDHKNAIQFQILADYNRGSEIIKNLKTEQCSEIKGLSESQWLRDLPDAYENAKHQGDVIIGQSVVAWFGSALLQCTSTRIYNNQTARGRGLRVRASILRGVVLASAVAPTATTSPT